MFEPKISDKSAQEVLIHKRVAGKSFDFGHQMTFLNKLVYIIN